MKKTQKAFQLAKERYAALGVDLDAAMARLENVQISLHCWQGDDLYGFESAGGLTDGGILTTGNYPGRARTPDELRADADKALSFIPGTHRFNIHAMYLESGGKKVDRDAIEPKHFANWIDWAKERGLGLDFNPTYFSHPLAADGFTLASTDKGKRDFWIEHGKRCRKVGEAMGKALGTPSVVNFWMPDGFKDIPADRLSPRRLMKESLDEIFARKISPKHELDAVECKLFGIGSECYVVGSHEFFMGYAVANKKLPTIDSGHFHPTEQIADKFSALSLYVGDFQLHVSRGVRWDSDHVVIWNDELRQIAEELVRCDLLGRAHIGLDYFDATVNRVGAWTIGVRATLKAILAALCDPIAELRRRETAGDFTGRLALLEEMKSMPFGAVWDYYCESKDVPVGTAWIDEMRKYEKNVQLKRG